MMDFDEILQSEKRFRYMLLSRMQSDCKYFLGNGNHSDNCLWGGNVKDHIRYMKALWESFSDNDKPEWLTYEELENYEKQMDPAIQNIDKKISVVHAADSISYKEQKRNITLPER